VSSAELLTDAFGRIRDNVHGAVSGLSADQLTARVDQDANSIGWLCWHLTRVQDDHVAGAFGVAQVWPAFMDRFGLPFRAGDIGYGHNSAQVADVRVPSGDLLIDYHDAVYAQTVDLVAGVTDADLPKVGDEGWDPPVTLGVRLVSVISDGLQHVGQAAFVRGIVLRSARRG
jgi:hypothetical protein